MKRRLTSIILSAVLLISSVVPSGTAFAGDVVGLQDSKVKQLESEILASRGKANSVVADFVRQGKNRKDNESVTVTVEIDSKIMAEKHNLQETEASRLKSREGLAEQVEYAKKSQEILKKKINRLGVRYEVLDTMDVTLNALVIRTTFANAKKIVALPEVKSSEIDVPIPAPKLQDKRPEITVKDAGSNPMIGVDGDDFEYKGKGQIVSVIDSGFDPSHEAFQKVSYDTLKIKGREAGEKLIKELNLDGGYFSDKFPFGYNYMEKNLELVEESVGSHGMHVAGIIGANGDKLKGVTPEVQLLAMRVFSDRIDPGSTSASVYNKAIDDSVKLGADSINMSLGATSVSERYVEQTTINALERAEKAGIVVAIAIGNDSFLGSRELVRPPASVPDIGLTGSPGIAELSLAVASVNNAKIKQKRITGTDNGEKYYFVFTSNDIAQPEGEQNFVHVGLGKEADFEGKDVSGKVALIQRGEITFSQKAKNAQAKGAIGAIIYNNLPSAPLVNMDLEDVSIPAFFISKEDGEILVSKPNMRLTFSNEEVYMDNPAGYQISDFSSWGLSAEGNMKPDITAPGGDIYSTLNENSYGMMSGTSMASPHAAAGIAIVKQYVEKTFPEIQGKEKYKLIKNLLMSSSVPLTDKQTKAYVSPRSQGAGLMNLARAVRSSVIVEGTNGYSSVNLKTIKGNTVVINATLRNYAKEDKEFVYYAVLNTDTVENGQAMLKPKAIKKFEQKTVVVPGGKTKDIEVAFILTSDEIAMLEKDMPQGFFLEGYVFFEAPASQKEREMEAFSFPFVGFRGEWDRITVLDPSVYDHIANGTRPFYYEAAKDSYKPFTFIASRDDGMFVALGEDEDNTFENPKYDAEKIAISPNGDGKGDFAQFFGTFLRNYNGFEIRVFDQRNLNTELYKVAEPDDVGRKNFIRPSMFGNSNHNSSKMHWRWDGMNQQGEIMPDGKYVFEVSVKPDSSENAPAQKMKLPILIDTIAPKIKKSSYDADKHIFTLEEVIEQGSGIRSQIIVKGREIFKPDAEGKFQLKPEIKIEDATLKISDYAYNTISLPLDKAIRRGNERSIIVKPVIDSGAVTANKFKWAVEDLDGNVIENPYNLEVGKYYLVISDVDEAYEISGPSRIPFEITEKDVDKVIEVPFVYKNRAKVVIEVKNPQNAAVKLVVLDKNKGIEFATTPLSSDKYGANVPEGEYVVALKQLDKDFFAYIKNEDVLVRRSGQEGSTPIVEIHKKEMQQGLVNLVRNGYEGRATVQFVGRDAKKTTYSVDLEAGKNNQMIELPKGLNFDIYVTDLETEDYASKPAEFTISGNNLLATVELEKGGAKNPIPVDKTMLRILINRSREYMEKDFSPESWADFEIALAEAEKVYNNPEATQAMVDKAASELKLAIEQLVPIVNAGDKALLRKKIDEAKELLRKHRDEYQNASVIDLEALIAEAEELYNSKKPEHNTKERINFAIAELERAMREMKRKDGKVDKTKLADLLKEAEEIFKNRELYVEEDIAALEKGYDFAKKVFENDNATEVQVTHAIQKISLPLKKLRLKDSDKEKLKEEIRISEAIDLSKYALEGKAEFREALRKAKAVYMNRRATQDEINKAYEELFAKRQALKPISEDDKEEATYHVPVRLMETDGAEESTGNAFLSSDAIVEKTKDGYRYKLTFNTSYIDLGMDGVEGNVTELYIKDGSGYSKLEAKEVSNSILEYTFESDKKLDEQEVLYVIDFMVDYGIPNYEAKLMFDWNRAKIS